MKTIELEFTKAGFAHRVLERKGNILLVQRQHHDVSTPHWEVVKIRVRPERLLGGRLVEGGEAYPAPEEWGTYGWTYSDLESAKAKFNALTQ